MQPDNADTVLQFSDYRLNPADHTLTDLTGQEIPLTPGEFRLLTAFLQRPGRVLSRDDLLTANSGRDADTFDRSIDMLTMRLRRKIEPDPKHPSLIVTVPGTGYKFAARVTKADIPTPAEAVAEITGPLVVAPAPSERRHLTVLQCALAGPTFLAARHDADDLHTLLAAFHKQSVRVITEAGGTVERFSKRWCSGLLWLSPGG